MQSFSSENEGKQKGFKIEEANLDEEVSKGLALNGFPACWAPLWSGCRSQGLCLAWSDLMLTFPTRFVSIPRSYGHARGRAGGCCVCTHFQWFSASDFCCLSTIFLLHLFWWLVFTGRFTWPSRAESWAHAEFVWSAGPCLLLWLSQIVSGDEGKKRQGEPGCSQENRNLKVNLLGNIGSQTQFFYLHIDL